MKPNLFNNVKTNIYIEKYKNKIESKNFIKNNIYNIISFFFISGIIMYLVYKYNQKKKAKEDKEYEEEQVLKEYEKQLELYNVYNSINENENEKEKEGQENKNQSSNKYINIDSSVINNSMDPIDYVPDPLEYNLQNDLNIIDLTNKQYTTSSSFI